MSEEQKGKKLLGGTLCKSMFSVELEKLEMSVKTHVCSRLSHGNSFCCALMMGAGRKTVYCSCICLSGGILGLMRAKCAAI